MTAGRFAVLLVFLSSAALAAPPAPAAVTGPAAPENPFSKMARPDAARYKSCMQEVARNPKAALEAGFLWKDHEGGVPAKHCIGAALAALDRYPEAAAWFEEAADDIAAGRGLEAEGAAGSPALIARLRDQAGNVWMLADNYERAYKAFSAAALVAPDKTPVSQDVYFDRAQAAAALGNYKQALADLTRVILNDRERIDALTLRAAAHRALGETDMAAADLGRALALDPEDGDALLERGNLRRAEGDREGARLDWVRVLAYYPGTDLAEQALDNLEMLKLKR